MIFARNKCLLCLPPSAVLNSSAQGPEAGLVCAAGCGGYLAGGGRIAPVMDLIGPSADPQSISVQKTVTSSLEN